MAMLESILTKALHDNQILLDHLTRNKLIHYLELLKRWNRVYNLTAMTRDRDMVYLHILDSLAILPFLHGKNILDVGTGAGMPGIPLAIATQAENNERCFTLLDKNAKKTRFLTQVIAECDLATTVTVVQKRCEDFYPANCFDTILARAFATLKHFADVSSRLLCDDGVLLAMKGQYPAQELRSLPRDNYWVACQSIQVTGMHRERHIVTIKKRT